MRYVAIYLGIGGWQPHMSADVFANGYGDCKDLAVMYVSMLRNAGVRAVPALVLTKNYGTTDPSFPTISNFNHMIYFCVNGPDTVWADATCPYCDVGDLPEVDEDVWALAIDSSGGRIVKSKHSVPDENKTIRRIAIDINLDKSILVSIAFTLTGNNRHRLISMLSDIEKHEQAKIFESDIFGITSAFQVDSFSLPQRGDYSSPLTATLYGYVKNAILNAGTAWYINVEFLSDGGFCEGIDVATRKRGLNLRYPRTYIDSIQIMVPEFWTAMNLPEDIEFIDDFGSIVKRYRVVENVLAVTRERSSSKYSIMPEQFPIYKIHIDTFNALSCKHIALYEKK